MDEIPEIKQEDFDLQTYINNKHPTYTTSILSTSLARLQHIRKGQDKTILDVFNTNSLNFSLIHQIDNLNTKLHAKIDKSEKEEGDMGEIKEKKFCSELSIKKFKDSLEKFQENLDVFVTESRTLEYESEGLFLRLKGEALKKIDTDGKIEQKDINKGKWIPGCLILSNDILFIGRKETNGFLLEDSFSYDLIQKKVLAENIKVNDIHNKQFLENIENEEFSVLSIKSPSKTMLVLMATKEILKILTVFDMCNFQKVKPKKYKRDLKRIEYYIQTEQYKKIQRLVEKNKNKEKIVKEKHWNKGFFLNQEKKFVPNDILNKIVLSLDHQCNTFEDVCILLQIVDPVRYLYSVFKQNFPTHQVKGFIEIYCEYYSKFLEESHRITVEIQKKNKGLEIVEINLLLKEKVTRFLIRQCMRQILWRGRRTDEVDVLIDLLKSKLDLKYLVSEFDENVARWKEGRRKYGEMLLTEAAKKVDEMKIE